MLTELFSEDNLEALRKRLCVGNRTLPLVLMIAVVTYLGIMATLSGLTTYDSVRHYVQLTAATTEGGQSIVQQLTTAPALSSSTTVEYGGISLSVPAMGDHGALTLEQRRNIVLAEYAAVLYHVGGSGNVGRAYSVMGDQAHNLYQTLWYIGAVMFGFVLLVMLANYEPWEAVSKLGYCIAAGGAATFVVGFAMVSFMAPQLDTTSRVLIQAYPVVVSGIQWSFGFQMLKYLVIGGIIFGIGKIMSVSDGMPKTADRSEE